MRLICSGVGMRFETPGTTVEALADVNFETREGEFVAIVGPSGAGKTTLLRAIAGLVHPQQGTIRRVSSGETDQRALIVSQENSLFPWMTVVDNAAFGLEMMKVGKAERRAHAQKLLQRFGMAGWDDFYPSQLSLGMKQRVAVIRAFLGNPALLLMDEPFSTLDVQTRLTLQEELLALWEQSHKSVIFVTHDVEEAILLSDRILVLGKRPGTVVASFPVTFPRPRHVTMTLDEDFLQLKREVWAKLGLEARQEGVCAS